MTKFRELVLFTGTLIAPRTIASVQFEMPTLVKSTQQYAVWIVWNLDRVESPRGFVPAVPAGWLAEGRSRQNLLPWVAKMSTPTSEKSHHFLVEREWLRMALNTLADILAHVDDTSLVIFEFDGVIFTIRCAGRAVPVPGRSEAWASRYTMAAGKLRNLPKRLMRDPVSVSVGDGWLQLHMTRYRPVATVEPAQGRT